MTDTDGQLQKLRQSLDGLDAEFIQLVARRQQLVSEIGEIKAQQGRQLRDFRREREVLDGVRNHAAAAGLDPNLAEDLVRRLIEASLTRQEQEQVKRSNRGEGKRALVIGGAGRLGQWLVNFLDAQGHDVAIADPKIGATDGESSKCASQVVSDWKEAGSDFDVIVLATPPGISQTIILDLMADSCKALVFDVASIKSPLISTLAKAAQGGMNICSMHPMFGPSTALLSGRHVLVMDVGCPKAVEEAKKLFVDTMAQTVEIPLETHDRLMALVLGLSHLINLVFVTALLQINVPADELAELSSTTFERQLRISRDVVNESPTLYYEIQKLNAHGGLARNALSSAVQLLEKAVAADEPTDFIDLMTRGQNYLQSLEKP